MRQIPVCFFVKKEKISGTLHLPSNKNPPVVVILHGLSSNKDTSVRIDFAKKICENGFAVLRFDFRCHGKSGGKPEELTYTGAVEDLKAAIDFVQKQKGIDSKRIGIQGSSFGGKVALIAASHDKRIKVLAVWVAPHIYTKDEIKEKLKIIRQKGYYPYKRNFHLGKAYFDDNKKYYMPSMSSIAKKIKAPSLVILAEKDTVVNFSIAKKFYDKLAGPKRLVTIKNSDHWITDNPKNRELVNSLSIKWFKEWLK